MARPLRTEGDGLIHHVTARSHTHAPAFPTDHSRIAFLELVGSAAAKLQWAVAAYCVLTTHYHLLVLTPLPNLAEGMRLIQGRYAFRLNSARGSRGPVWEGRYHSRSLQSSTHVVRAAVYIDLNAFAAGVVDDPSAWPWCSYEANTGIAPGPGWHHPGVVHHHVGAFADEAASVYRELVESRLEVLRAERGQTRVSDPHPDRHRRPTRPTGSDTSV
ncbi:MAG: transposase [Gaiella sp.]